MGMGWKNREYSYESNRRKCKCGKGQIITIRNITEESEFPPFERGTEKIVSTCPDNCEHNNGRSSSI